MAAIARGDAIALTRALVAIDSRNPSLVPGAPGESKAAEFLRATLTAWGFTSSIQEAAPGRPNVIARLSSRSGKSLMLNGHLDVVGVEGMSHEPFDAAIRDGKIYGRGSADMKAGISAACAAAVEAFDAGIKGDIIITAVADEEFDSIGTQSLIKNGIRADAAIVVEPTRLSICPAHRGFAWIEVEVIGRAAHGSRYDIGVDAITNAGLLLTELARLETEVLPGRNHRLLGRPSVHASKIEGGTGMSTYPERCKLAIERRTIPGETAEDAAREIELLCAGLEAKRNDFHATVTLAGGQPPSDVAEDSPIVRALESGLSAARHPVRMEGLSAWTDAALLNGAGIPAICFGPGDIALAHSHEEFVEVGEIETAVKVLAGTIRNWLA